MFSPFFLHAFPFSRMFSVFTYVLSFLPVFFLFLHVFPFFGMLSPLSYTFSRLPYVFFFSYVFLLFLRVFSFPIRFPLFSICFPPFLYAFPIYFPFFLHAFPFSLFFCPFPAHFPLFPARFPFFPPCPVLSEVPRPPQCAVSPWQPRVLQVCHPPDEADPEGPRQRHLHQTPGGGEGEEGQLRPRGLCPRSGDHRSGPRHQGNAEASGLRQPVQPAGHAAHGGDELQNTPRSSLRQSLLCHFSNKRGKPTRTAWSFEACARRGFPAGMRACCSQDGGAQPGEGERGVSSPSAPPSFVLCCL